MNLKSVCVLVIQSKGFNRWRKSGRQIERVSREECNGKDGNCSLSSIDLSPDSHWLLLNRRP